MRGWMVGCLVTVLLAVLALPALAWGPGAHAIIALDVAEEKGSVIGYSILGAQVVYGAIAPDLAWQADEPLATNLGAATHDDPGYREPWDLALLWPIPKRSFSYGWMTHNQAWGADYYAHIADPFLGALAGPDSGYVVQRAALLAAQQSISEDVAHDYIEVAIDLLLDQEYPDLSVGDIVSQAAYWRNYKIGVLLTMCYADVPGADGPTLILLEKAFRRGIAVYGEALAYPTDDDDFLFALGMSVRYGLPLNQSISCLAAAKDLCLETGARYDDAMAATTALIAAHPWS
jgi:hypothetical protein